MNVKSEPTLQTPAVRSADIRLVAIDLDGTLLNDAKQISERNLRAIRDTIAAGVKVVIASARPPRSVRGFYRSLSLDTLQINYNGALVWDEPNRAVIAHRPILPELTRRMIDLARSQHADVLVSCEILDRWCTDRIDPAYNTETAKLFPPDLIAPLEEFCGQPISKLLLMGDPPSVAKIKTSLEQACGVEVAIVQTEADLLQITVCGVSKAAALADVANHYGVAAANILAIGDATNDLAMIEMVGVGVAVGNAHPVVRETADWVSATNNDDGVAEALQRFGLCG